MTRPAPRTPGLAATLLLALAGSALAAPAPRRVVSLNLASDEILSAILPPDRLVAVTALADERGTSNVVGRVPPSVARLPRADLERLVALSPDLVVVSEYTDPDVLRLLEGAGVRTFRLRGLRSFPGYRQAILDLGGEVGEPAAATRIVARYDAVLARLRGHLAGVARPRVLYWAEGMTAGGDTAIGALVEEAGATNAAAAAGVTGIAPVGAERAFALDPRAVLIGAWPGTRQALLTHPLLGRMPAVIEGRVVQMPTELLVAVSQYAAEAAWRLAHLLHPDRVATPDP